MRLVSVIWGSSYHANKPLLSLSELTSYTAKNMVDERNIFLPNIFSASLCKIFLSVITWHWFERLNFYKTVRLSQTLWLRRSIRKVGGHQMTLKRKLSQQSSADEFSSAQTGILVSATTCITAVTKLLLSYSHCQTFTCTRKEHACHGSLNFQRFLEL